MLFVVYTEDDSQNPTHRSPPRYRNREINMSNPEEFDPMSPRPNLDFSKGVRGKYYDRMKAGTNIVLIDPDLLDTFPDSASVNEALRSLKKIATRSTKPAQRLGKTASASS